MAALPPNWGNPFASSAAPPPSGGSSSSNGRAPGLGRDAPVPAEMSPAVAFGAPQTQAHADATAHDLVPNYAAAYPYIAREADEVELNKGMPSGGAKQRRKGIKLGQRTTEGRKKWIADSQAKEAKGEQRQRRVRLDQQPQCS